MNMYSITKNTDLKIDILIVPIIEEKSLDSQIKSLEKQYQNVISGVVQSKDFEPKKLATSLLFTHDQNVKRILLVGLGKESDIDIKRYKEVIGAGIIFSQGKKYKKIGLLIPSSLVKKFGEYAIGLETAVAVGIASYAYDEHKSDVDAKISQLEHVEIVDTFESAGKRQFEKGISEGKMVAEGVNFARHLGNTPPTVMTPTFLAHEAEQLSKKNKKLKTTILSEADMKKIGMGCILGVSRGSEEEAKFIIVEYWGASKKDAPTVLVGKGITFDSGGLDIKPRDAMIDMKFDMLGAASVLASIKVAAELGLKKNIIVLIPAAENMPSGTAYRPDDILKAMNGKTVEIKDTDAEGRLILADALCYAEKYKPKEVIDLATLTGACMVAIGTERSGLFTPEEKLSKSLQEASEEVGEQLWRLPLGEEYSEAMKSEIADIKNTSEGRFGGASTGAAFLQFFTSYPWAHIDLASAIYASKGKPWIRAGANGFGVQLLVSYLCKFGR